MGKVTSGLTMSLDGFIAGPNEGPGNGLGDGGEVLHEWVFAGSGGTGDNRNAGAGLEGADRRVVDELMATGAVVAGRGTFEPAGGWNGDHHGGVPIFILSRGPAPDWAAGWKNVRYLPDLAEAMAAARQASGERKVLVHGAGIAQRALNAGLLDEIELHLVPVLLGSGRRLFGGLDNPPRLEPTRVLKGDRVTHLHYRIVS